MHPATMTPGFSSSPLCQQDSEFLPRNQPYTRIKKQVIPSKDDSRCISHAQFNSTETCVDWIHTVRLKTSSGSVFSSGAEYCTGNHVIYQRKQVTHLMTYYDFRFSQRRFWDITPCNPLKVNGSFGEKCHLHLQGSPLFFHFFSRWFLARSILRPSRWRRYFPPKSLLNFNGLHGVIYQKITLFIYKIFRRTEYLS
jgi:hypothetical protein